MGKLLTFQIKHVKKQLRKVFNSVVATSMLLNSFSPLIFLGDIGNPNTTLKSSHRSPSQFLMKAAQTDLITEFPRSDLNQVHVFKGQSNQSPDFADALAFGIDFLPVWMADSDSQPALGSSLLPSWMAETEETKDLGDQFLPEWMAEGKDPSLALPGDVSGPDLLFVNTPQALLDAGNCPPAANLVLNLSLPPDPVSRGDTSGQTYTMTITNNDPSPVPEISFQIDPNQGFNYLGGTASATSSVSGTLTLVDPGTGAADAPVIIGFNEGPAPEKQLLPNETITLTFPLATDADARSGQQLFVNFRSGSPPTQCAFAVENIQTVRGNLVIEKSPSTQIGTLGDTLTWTVRLRNTGLGWVYGAVFTDVIGAGYENVIGIGSSAPIDLAPENYQDYEVQGTIASCTNLTNTIDGAWSIGNSDGTAIQPNPLNETVDVLFQLEEPDIRVEIGSIPTTTYCGSYTVQVPVTVTNVGGPAQFLELDLSAQNLSVTESDPNWDQPGGTNSRLEYIGGSPVGTILAGEVLTFELQVVLSSAACASGDAAITLMPSFYDACLLLRDSASASTSSSPIAEDAATLNISKDGPAVIAAGDIFTYTVIASGENQESIDPGGVMITDVLPSSLIVNNITRTAGTVTQTGDTINWHLPLSGNGPYYEVLEIVVTVPELGGGVCDSGVGFINQVWGNADVCPECTPLEASAEVFSHVEDYLGTNNIYTKTASTVELCWPGAGQVITTILDIQDGITWTGTIYTDTLGAGVFNNPLNVVSLQVNIDGTDRTSDLFPAPSYGPPLVVDFSNIGTYSSTAYVEIIYVVTAPVGTIPGDAASQTSFLYSEIVFGDTTNACGPGDAVGYVGDNYTIQRGDLNIVATPGVIDSCAESTVLINVTAGGTALTTTLTDNLVVSFTAQAGDIFTHTEAIFGGSFSAASVISNRVGTTVVFTFLSTIDLNEAGTIEFPLFRPCTVDGPISSQIGYQDRCNVTRTSGGMATGTTRVSDINLFTTPDKYTVNERKAVWRFYVSSIGTATAEDLIVTNTLPIGHRFVTYTLSSSSAPTNVVSMVTDTVAGQVVITFTIDNLPVGGRLQFDMESEIDSACNLPAVIHIALWDSCGGVNGACEGYQTGDVELLPGPYFLLTSNDQVAALPLCDQGPVQLVVKNSSAKAPEYHFTITDVITNATFFAGSAFVTVTNQSNEIITGTSSGVPLANIPFPPTIAVTALGEIMSWTDGDFTLGTAQYDVLAKRDASDVITIDFLLDTSCVSRDTQVQSAVGARDVCQQPLLSNEDAQTLVTAEPELVVNKTGYNASTGTALITSTIVLGSAGDTIVWFIDVTNIGEQRVTNLFVTDTVPTDFIITDVSSGGSILAGGTLASWGSTGGLSLNVDELRTFVITGTVGSTTCAVDRRNTALVSHGCSTTDICAVTPLISTAILRTRPITTELYSEAFLGSCGGNVIITVTNEGPPAQDFILTDTLHSQFVFESFVTATTVPNIIPIEGDNPITFGWTGGVSLPTGTTSITFRVRNAYTTGACVPRTAFIPNLLEIEYDDTCDATGPYTDTVTDTLYVGSSTLLVQKTPTSQTSDVGETVTWNLDIQNTGNRYAYNVVVTDVVSTNFNNVTGTVGSSPSAGSNNPTNPLTNTIVWQPALGIYPGQSWSADVTADVLFSGNNTNTVEAVGFCNSGCYYASGNDIAYVTLLEEFVKSPAIQTGTIGSVMVFTFSVRLSDRDGLYENSILTDSLPIGLGYMDADLVYTTDGDNNGGGTATTPVPSPSSNPGLYNSGDVVWDLGDLEGTVQITGVITGVIQNILSNQHGVRLTNQMDLTYIQDTQFYSYIATADVDIVEPDLTIVKEVLPSAAEPGDTVYYSIELYHTPIPSPVVTAYNVLITDVVPAWLDYIPGSFSQSNGPTALTLDDNSAPTLTASWNEVPTNVVTANPIRLTYAARITDSAPIGEGLRNVVTTTWTSLPDDPYGEARDGDDGHGSADDYHDSDDAMVGLSEVSLDKTAPLTVVAGTDITYTIYVTNEGPETATGAIVTDTMPFQVTTNSALFNVPGGSSGSCSITPNPAGDIVVCNLGDIGADIVGTITIIGRVAADTPEGADLTNQAELSVTSSDGDPDNNSDEEDTEVYTEADNAVDKTCQPTVNAGETVTCTITVENTGPSVSRDVDIKDILPAGLTWVGGSTPGGTCVNSICQLGDVDVGEVVNIVVTATVESNISGTLTNEAIVFSDTHDPDPGNDSDTDTFTVNSLTTLQIAKVDLSDPVYAGNTYLYEIVITNTGPSDAQDVTITDTLPLSTTFEGASPGCTHNTGVVTCLLGTLAANEIRDLLINVRVAADVISGTQQTNTVVVTTSTDIDLVNSILSDDEETTYYQQAGNPTDLELDKSVTPATQIAGNGQFTYILTVTNNGPASANAVQVLDAFPREFDFISATASNGATCNAGMTCDLGVIDVDEDVLITLVVGVPADVPTGTYTNTAYVGSASPDSNPNNNDASASSTVTNLANLQIRKLADPVTGTPGEDLDYTIIVTNTGPSDAENVTVSDLLPGEFNLVFVTSSQGGCSNLPCSLGILVPNASATVRIHGTVAPDAVGNLSNTASVTSTTPGSGDSDTIVTTLSSGLDLALVKSATPTVYAGEPIEYSITVYNQGTADATNVMVTDTLPLSVTFNSASPSCSAGSSIVTCGPFNLSAGTNTNFTITLNSDPDILPGTSLENSAVVASDGTEIDLENNQDDADTSILGLADVGLVKTGTGTVNAGEIVTYTLVITNDGPSTGRSVDVKDLLPAGMTYLEASTSSGFCVPGVCQLGDLEVGQTVTVIITASVGSDLTGTVINAAQVFADTPDPDLDNNDDTAETTFETLADLWVAKVDLSDPVEPTGGLLYELVVTNDGPSDARDVVLTDSLDSNVSFAGASLGCLHDDSPTDGDVVCTLGTLSAGTSERFLVGVEVGDVPSGTILTNGVVVSSSTLDDDGDNNSANVTTTVQQDLGPAVDLGITKADDPDLVFAGELVTYTLTITNDGPGIATNVRVLELIPVGTTVQSITVDNPDDEGEYCSNGGSCYLGTVGTDTTVVVTVVLQVNDDFSGDELTNSASVSGDQQESDPEDNIASENTDVDHQVDLVIKKK